VTELVALRWITIAVWSYYSPTLGPFLCRYQGSDAAFGVLRDTLDTTRACLCFSSPVSIPFSFLVFIPKLLKPTFLNRPAVPRRFIGVLRDTLDTMRACLCFSCPVSIPFSFLVFIPKKFFEIHSLNRPANQMVDAKFHQKL